MGVKVDYQNKIIAEDLDTVYLTGAGFIRRAFKGISRDSAWGWEASVWGGELTRSKGDFVLTNIQTVDFGKVPRCEISYKYMNIQDYMDLMKISKERVVLVDFFNRETGKRETREMAFTENELDKLYSFGSDYLGVMGVKIKLVATNREMAKLIKTKFTVSYHANGGMGAIESQTDTWSEGLTLSDGTGMSNGNLKLAYWATKNTKGEFDRFYLPGQTITLWEDLRLHAIWEG